MILHDFSLFFVDDQSIIAELIFLIYFLPLLLIQKYFKFKANIHVKYNGIHIYIKVIVFSEFHI